MIGDSFLLFLIALPGLLAQNYSVVCARIDPSYDLYQFCTSTADSLVEYEEFFSKYYFGSPDMLKAVDETKIEAITGICQRYSNCPPTNRLNCFLPLMNATDVCTRIKILRSPFGACMRKFQTKRIKSLALESWLRDFTNYGVAGKCNDLKYPAAVMEGIYFECGEPAEESFKSFIGVFKSYFDC